MPFQVPAFYIEVSLSIMNHFSGTPLSIRNNSLTYVVTRCSFGCCAVFVQLVHSISPLENLLPDCPRSAFPMDA